jgi:hypothetical protein
MRGVLHTFSFLEVGIRLLPRCGMSLPQLAQGILLFALRQNDWIPLLFLSTGMSQDFFRSEKTATGTASLLCDWDSRPGRGE